MTEYEEKRINVLEYSIKTTTSMCTKIVLEQELNNLKNKKANETNKT